MSAIWRHRLVLSIKLDLQYFTEWFGLEPVDGVRKNPDGSRSVYLKDVVLDGLFRPGLSIVTAGDNWLCRDEEDRWWIIDNETYATLGPDHHVTLWPNEATWRQVAAIKAADKLKKDFEAMSEREQKEIYKLYPELFK
jgi:hypothetical protein